MRFNKLILMALVTGCGSYDAKLTQEKKTTTEETPPAVVDDKSGAKTDPAATTSQTSSDPKSASTKDAPTKDTTSTSASAAKDKTASSGATNTVIALKFLPSTKISNVSLIISATKIFNNIYFTGEDLKGNKVLGKMTPDDTKAVLTPIAKLNANNITLSGDYYLPSNVDDDLYLIQGDQIIEVDLQSLKAVGKVTSKCGNRQQSTFLKDDHWNTIFASKLDTCGKVDGASLKMRQDILDGYTGEVLAFDNYSSFTFDGVKLYQYRAALTQLTIFDKNFAKGTVYSTSAYLYNDPSSVLVSDSAGDKWLVGCVKGDCYLTEVSFTDQ